MIIRSMTADFGKLNHETLTLKPGLNVIHAPNEWGKSTWCAFLMAMLYGIDTAQRDRKDTPADKNRYAPWTGTPMSGRMELESDGRELTLERSTAGRIPMGTLRIWETDSGIPVTSLNTDNCAETLLGAQRGVYERTGFIRLTDMPVTRSDELQDRLIALVTTGDETGSNQKLSEGLAQLRSRIIRKGGGLLPKARQELDAAASDLRELEKLTEGRSQLESELEERELEIGALENHLAALTYSEYNDAREHLAQAEQALTDAQQLLGDLELGCADLTDEEALLIRRDELYELKEALQGLRRRWHQIPMPPPKPKAPPVFEGCLPRQAREQVREDTVRLLSVTGSGWKGFAAIGAALFVIGCVLWPLWGFAMGFLFLTAGLALALPALIRHRSARADAEELYEKYGSEDPGDWAALADGWAEAVAEYQGIVAAFRKGKADADRLKAELKLRMDKLCPDGDPAGELTRIEESLVMLRKLDQARAAAEQAQLHRDTLAQVVRPVPEPRQADCLTFDKAQTDARLEEARSDRASLAERIGRYTGRMEQLDSADALRSRIEAAQRRVKQLEQTLAAVELSARTLADAEATLRRRFAPRIAAKAKLYSARLTAGRYDRLTLDDELAIAAGSGQELLRDIPWFSDGTVDQLYLALRLAVADALIPGAPLVLDDALVRFDDSRMGCTMELLQELAQSRQILLFTCQSRERNWLKDHSREAEL